METTRNFKYWNNNLTIIPWKTAAGQQPISTDSQVKVACQPAYETI